MRRTALPRGRLIESVGFAAHLPLPVEVLTVQALHAREPRDLTRPRRPDFHHLFFATRGSGWHTVDFVEHRLSAGQVLTAAAGQVHQFAPKGDFDAQLLVFEPDVVRWRPPLTAEVVTLDDSRLQTVRALFDALARELAAPTRSQALVFQLVEALGVACSSNAPAPVEGQQLVERFRRELERHFRKTHEVAAYAAILRCTTKTLTRHCLAQAGLPPKRLIDERVVLEARRSLAHEDRTIADLSEHLGFAAPSQFVKFFKRLTRETPATFRERFRTG